MYRYVVPYLGDRERDADRWFYVVGALFAWHPKQENGQSFAASFGKLWKQQRKLWKQQSRSDSVEARFFALLNSHPDDLPDHLRQAVGLLRAQEIGLDWFRLLRDLVRWSRPNRTVQNRWAREFYRGDRSQAVHADESDSDGEESEE
jgi:CRISPR system Cascade subunit CasB